MAYGSGYVACVIEVSDLSKSFDSGGGAQVLALEKVGFCVESGRVHALLGPNGSGKTTLLRCVAGLLHPTEGRILVDGKDPVLEGDWVRRRLGFLTGTMKMPRRLTAREVLEFFGRLRGLEGGVLEERIEALIKRLEMESFIDRRMDVLSMGQRQRTGIAQALVHDPPVLILDEVTVGLDVLAAREIIDWVAELASAGRTILFSSHIMSEVSVLAGTVSILKEGRVIFDGSLKELERGSAGRGLEEEFIRRLRQS